MTLVWLLALPLIGGIAAWAVGKAGPAASRTVSIVTLLAMALMAFGYLPAALSGIRTVDSVSVPWIEALGIRFSLHLDGLSLPLIILSILLSIIAVLVSGKSVTERQGAYHFNVLWVLSGTLGVFLARDLFLFFFCWELMVVPMAFIIAFWGGEKRHYAATRFFIFTQASGLLMLISIIALAYNHHEQTGVISFLYDDLLGDSLGRNGILLFGFFVAFAVKLPVAPFHAWQADAYTEAPTGGSIILAGFLSKTGGYGLIRFILPLFQDASVQLAPWAIGLGVFTLVYGAMLAFAQSDLKRIIAYSSLSHMGFIIIGVFAGNLYGYQGAVVFMFSHGFATSALFVIVDMIERRAGHRDLTRMGGVGRLAPRFTGITMFFVLASLGLPSSGNFVGEILVLAGAFQTEVVLATLAGFGLIFPAVYSLYFIQRVLHGETAAGLSFPEMKAREYLLLACMGVVVLWVGLRPQILLDAAENAWDPIRHTLAVTTETNPPSGADPVFVADAAPESETESILQAKP